ncbi:hypothetical protein ACIQVK_02870 [Streptomyces sp. NPDC090493]|uniref:hypothetical protein n=1 Tax=Streptomyces sp. NPDC090493 TaxID=3365964 RepID=UPI00381C7F56
MTVAAEATRRRVKIVRAAARLVDEKAYHNTGHRDVPEPLHIGRSQPDRHRWLVEATIKDGIPQGIFRDVRVRPATLALFGITNWSCQWDKPPRTRRRATRLLPQGPRAAVTSTGVLRVAGTGRLPFRHRRPGHRTTVTAPCYPA